MDIKRVFQIALAVICGELLMIILITLAQEVVVNGVKVGTSPISDIAIGGIGTLLSGAIAGFIATLIVGRTSKLPALILSILVVTETTYLILSNKILNPIWFDALAALSLIGSIWIGYYLYTTKRQPRKSNLI